MISFMLNPVFAKCKNLIRLYDHVKNKVAIMDAFFFALKCSPSGVKKKKIKGKN